MDVASGGYSGNTCVSLPPRGTWPQRHLEGAMALISYFACSSALIVFRSCSPFLPIVRCPVCFRSVFFSVLGSKTESACLQLPLAVKRGDTLAETYRTFGQPAGRTRMTPQQKGCHQPLVIEHQSKTSPPRMRDRRTWAKSSFHAVQILPENHSSFVPSVDYRSR